MKVIEINGKFWFGVAFPIDLFWDFDLHRITPEFMDHCTGYFKTLLQRDLVESVFNGSTDDDGSIDVNILEELRMVLSDYQKDYQGLYAFRINWPVVIDLGKSAELKPFVFFGWPIEELDIDGNLADAIHWFFEDGVSQFSNPVLVNMEGLK